MRYFGRSFARLSVALFAAALLAAPLSAQAPPVQQGQMQVPDSVQEMITEAQGLQQEITGLQTQAMESNEELMTMQNQLQEMVRAAITEIEPTFEQMMERMAELEAEFMTAQQEQDAQALQNLQMEAQSIQTRIQTAEQEALEQPEIQSEVEVFEEEMMAEMARHDPEAPEKMERLQDLAERIQAAMGDGLG